MFFWKAELHREWERNRSSFHLFTPNVQQSQARLIQSDELILALPRGWQGPERLGIFHCILRCIIWELDKKCSNWYWNWYPSGTLVPALRLHLFLHILSLPFLVRMISHNIIWFFFLRMIKRLRKNYFSKKICLSQKALSFPISVELLCDFEQLYRWRS